MPDPNTCELSSRRWSSIRFPSRISLVKELDANPQVRAERLGAHR